MVLFSITIIFLENGSDEINQGKNERKSIKKYQRSRNERDHLV